MIRRGLERPELTRPRPDDGLFSCPSSNSIDTYYVYTYNVRQESFAKHQAKIQYIQTGGRYAQYHHISG